jgi:hypothetical protein
MGHSGFRLGFGLATMKTYTMIVHFQDLTPISQWPVIYESMDVPLPLTRRTIFPVKTSPRFHFLH